MCSQPLMKNPVNSPILAEDMRLISETLGSAADQLQGRSLLITGAGGMLAGYLVESVAWMNRERFNRPCQIICLIRPGSKSRARFAHLAANQEITFVDQDVNAPLKYDGSADFIIHAASRASPKSYLCEPLDTMDANTTATKRLLDFARTRNSEGFLFFSSGEIYGDVPPEHMPTPETYTGTNDCTSPRACYTESKRFGETLCATYARQFGTPAVIVRPFHIFGPGMRLDDGRVIADFVRDRLESRSIRILSGGRAIRAFGYLADATIGFWQSLFSRLGGEAFNIGDDRNPLSIRDLAYLVASLEKPNLIVDIIEDNIPSHLVGSPSQVCPDISKARQLLGYEPNTDLEEGLMRLIAWYRSPSYTNCSTI